MNDNNTGGSFRIKRNPFTQVSNSALRDSNLSLKAKGLYGLIQSYITIPNFTLYKRHLMSLCKEKEKAFDSAWKELKDNGYLKQYRIPKGENDTFVYEYDLLDIADLTTPSLINLNKNGEEIKSNNGVNLEVKNGDSHTPHLVPYAKNDAESAYPPFSTLCETHPMPNAPYAERGGNKDIELKEDFKGIYIESKSESKSKSAVSEKLSTKEENDKTTDKDTTAAQQNFSEMKKEPSSIPLTDQSNGLNESPSENIKENTKQVLDDFSTIEKIIQDNIYYQDFLRDRVNIALVDNFIACMVDVMLTDDSAKITIGKGEYKEVKPISLVKSVFMKLNQNHILHALDQYKAQHHQITYKRPYIRSMLYNTYIEMDAHYTNQVRADGVVY